MKERGLYKQLWFWVIIAIALGIVVGIVAPGTAEKTKWLADAFIQLIKTVTGPVIFVTVVIGIASLGNLARAGGLALRALAYFFSMTVIALALGLIAANIFAPGSGFDGEPSESARESAKESIAEAGGTESGLVGFITDDLLPTSFVSAVRGQRDPARPGAGDPRRGGDLDARRPPPQADRQRLRGRVEGRSSA